jgi:hypothetical protein
LVIAQPQKPGATRNKGGLKFGRDQGRYATGSLSKSLYG